MSRRLPARVTTVVAMPEEPVMHESPSMRSPSSEREPASLPRWVWWITGLRALAAGTLGVMVLLRDLGRPALANFIAIYWLVGSLLTLRPVLAGRSGSRRHAAAAVLGMVAALLVLARLPLQRVVPGSTLLVVLGVAAILTGILRLGGGLADDQTTAERVRPWRRLSLGALEVLLGFVLLGSHDVSRTVTVVVGVWGIVGGATLVLDALAIRRAARPRG